MDETTAEHQGEGAIAMDDKTRDVVLEFERLKQTAHVELPKGRGGQSRLQTGWWRRKRQARDEQERAEIAKELGLDPNRAVTPVPAVPNGAKELGFSTIENDLVHVRILKDDATNIVEYHVIEPPLEPGEAEALLFIRDTLVRLLEPVASEEKGALEKRIRARILEIIADYEVLVDAVGEQRITHHLLREFLGFGRIDPLLRDPMLEDISCDGPGIPIFVFHREHRSVATNLMFPTDEELDGFVVRLAQVSGKAISVAEPMLDATLPDGSRLQATLAREVTTRGSSFTIRRIRADPLTPPDLVRLGTISAEMAAYLWLAIENGKSLIMCGGTASGKTTSLNALALYVPATKKIVSIEDTREVVLPHANWIAGVTRKGFMGQTTGEIGMYRLLEAALRQRPDYLIVGEVRGVEAMTLFQAMATGHATYSTMHAETVAAAVHRLEHPPISIPRVMLGSLDLIAVQAQVRVGDRMSRRIKELTEITGFEARSGELLVNNVFRWDVRTDRMVFKGQSHILDRIAATKDWSQKQIVDELHQRTRVIEWMTQSGVRHVADVWRVISAYQSSPEAVLAKIQASSGGRAAESLSRDSPSGGGPTR